MPTKTKAKVETKTETKPSVIVKAFTKAVNVIRQWKDAQNKVTALFDTVGKTVKEEAQRLQYDEGQTREAVLLSLEEAYGFEGSDKERETFRLRYRPEVSKILRIAFPKDAKAEKELEAARVHNEDASLHDRIGANDLLEIARGNKTAKQVLSHKAAKKKAKTEYSMELFSSNIAAEISKARKADFSKDKVQKALDRAMAQWTEGEEEEGGEEEGEE